MSNFQLTANVMDRIMSTSVVSLELNSNANDVDIMVFELCVLFPLPPRGGGEIDDMVRNNYS